MPTFTVDAANSTNGNAGYTMFVMASWLPAGASISHLGLYNANGALSFQLKIAERTAAGTYDVSVDEAYSHGSTGWEDHELSTPYAVPALGEYFIGAYCASAYGAVSYPAGRAYFSGDMGIGSHSGGAEDYSYAPAMRFTYLLGASEGTIYSYDMTYASQGTGYTMYARSFPVLNGARITKIRFYSTSSVSLVLKLTKQTAEGSYADPSINQSYSHGGTGWEEVDVDFSVPETGDYYLGVYSVVGWSGVAQGGNRDYKTGDITAAASGFLRQNVAGSPPMGYSYITGSGLTVTRNVSLNVGMTQ